MENSSNSDRSLPILVGITGGTASGKTSVCEYLLKSTGILLFK
jgi:uridine kinase